MFSNWFLKSFRILLLPFSILFGIIVLVRNKLYDRGILKSHQFGLPLICVGNLSVGGTGKSPMVEYLVFLLRRKYRVATLSRGYKRKTRGYALANEQTTAIEIGDEPMLFFKKFPDVPVAIGEERLVAIPQLLQDKPETEVIILDDAFQHRQVHAGLNILLTDYGNLFTRDFFLPTGDLRDMRSSYTRAQILVVTKCPPNLGDWEREALEREIEPLPHQQLFFTSISYGTAYHIIYRNHYHIRPETEVLLVTGIANPEPLKQYLEEQVSSYQMMHYNDHHIFSVDDWREIRKRFQSMDASDKIVLTTEKDAMRLLKFSNEIDGMPFYVLPIEHHFLFNEAERFAQEVTSYLDNFKKPPDGTKTRQENE